VIIIGLVGRHIRNHAVSTRDIGSRRGFPGAFFVAMLFSSPSPSEACGGEGRQRGAYRKLPIFR
jgi:hypothetical protein